MTLEEYFKYTPSASEKQERRDAFLRTHKGTLSPTIQGVINEIEDRINSSPDRILH